MTRCGFGYPIKPGSRHVFFCDDAAVCSFTQPITGMPGYSVQVRVCDAHAEWLRYEYLARNDAAVGDVPPSPEPSTPERANLIESAWGLLANVDEGNGIGASGDERSHQTTEWRAAAKRWRDGYHAWLAEFVHTGQLINGDAEHEHTESECGHTLVLHDSDDNSYVCLNCDDLHTQSRWCHERCAVFVAEVIESVKLAERTGDIPVSADETYEDWKGSTP